MDSSTIPDYSKINIYILKTIFFEFFFFNKIHEFIEKKKNWDYNTIRNEIITTQVNFSSILMKIVSYLELNQNYKIALDFLNNHLQFLFENELDFEALLLMFFILNFGERNEVEDINYEYYTQLINETKKKLDFDLEEILKIKELNETKYQFLKNLIDTFDVESVYKLENLTFLKVCFLVKLDDLKKNKVKRFSELKFLSFIFNEPSLYNNISKIESKLENSIIGKKKKETNFFSRLKTINKKLKKYEQFSCSYKVLKFNATSKGQCFRYFNANKYYIAVVPENKKNKIFTNFKNQRGVYSLNSLKGATSGIITNKQVLYRKKYFNKFNQFFPPIFKSTEELLKYNAIIPIFCVTFVFENKIFSLVFRNFLEVKILYKEFFGPFKYLMKSKYKKKVIVESLGKILWKKMRYQMIVLLGRKRILQSLPKNKKFTLCQLILLSKTYLFND